MEALSGDVAALSDDVAVKCMLGTVGCLLQEENSLGLLTKNPLRWPLAVWLDEQCLGRKSVDWQLVGADVWLKVHLE